MMNTKTFYFGSMDEAKADQKQLNTYSKYIKAMNIPPTKQQMLRNPPRIGRNEKCPCGSGKKFKKCCMHGANKL